MKNKKNTGKIILVSLLTILCTGVVASGLAYAGSCIKNGSEKTNETIKGWFDKEETDKSSEEDKTSEENKDSTSSEDTSSTPEVVKEKKLVLTKEKLDNSVYNGLLSNDDDCYVCSSFKVNDGLIIYFDYCFENLENFEIGITKLGDVIDEENFNYSSEVSVEGLIDSNVFEISQYGDIIFTEDINDSDFMIAFKNFYISSGNSSSGISISLNDLIGIELPIK